MLCYWWIRILGYHGIGVEIQEIRVLVYQGIGVLGYYSIGGLVDWCIRVLGY